MNETNSEGCGEKINLWTGLLQALFSKAYIEIVQTFKQTTY